MEASERPQLPLDDGPAEGTVRALDDRLVIERLTVDDARAARARPRARRGRQRAGRDGAQGDRDRQPGARAARGPRPNVDYVRRELERGPRRARRAARRTLEEGAEALAEQHRDRVRRRAKRLGPGADQGDRHRRERASSASELLRTRSPPRTASNPLARHPGPARARRCSRPRSATGPRSSELRESHSKEARAMQGQVAELRKEIARLLEQRRARRSSSPRPRRAGTRKGISFEERVHAAIEAIAAGRGDLRHAHRRRRAPRAAARRATRWSRSAPADGRLAGRIVFEAKDKQLSQERGLDRAQRARWRRRAASFAVLVVAGDENVPSGPRAADRVRGQQDDRRGRPRRARRARARLAYRLAAARVAMARDRDLAGRRGRRSATPPPRRSALLKQAQAIRSALTGIKTQLRQGPRGPRRDGRRVEDEARADRRLVAEAADRGRVATARRLGQQQVVLGARRARGRPSSSSSRAAESSPAVTS